MSAGGRRSAEQQATILRKNLTEWDRMLRTPRGEDWPTMVGRLNAALNQTANLDRSIEDVMEHFVYVPKKSTANPQDIPFFLSTRLEANADADGQTQDEVKFKGDPVQQLVKYESFAAQLAADYEDSMVRF